MLTYDHPRLDVIFLLFLLPLGMISPAVSSAKQKSSILKGKYLFLFLITYVPILIFFFLTLFELNMTLSIILLIFCGVLILFSLGIMINQMLKLEQDLVDILKIYRLLYFLGIFINVSIIFAFALFFHYKIDPASVLKKSSMSYKFVKSWEKVEDQFHYYFPKGSTKIFENKNDLRITSHFPNADQDNRSDNLRDTLTNTNKKTTDKLLQLLISKIRNHPWARYEFELYGYTDSTPVEEESKTGFISNYELAMDRCVKTELYLKEKIRERIIHEFDYNKITRLNYVFNKVAGTITKSGDSKNSLEALKARRVEIFFSVFYDDKIVRDFENTMNCEVTLAEMYYFMTYTITTTGYGDILPNSSFAKFLCTFANFFEVFFLVVFLNVLMNGGHEPDKDKETIPEDGEVNAIVGEK